MVPKKLRNTLHVQNGPEIPPKMVPSRGDHINKMFFGAETITNTSTRSFEKMLLDGHPQEIEEHMGQNGPKYNQMAPKRRCYEKLVFRVQQYQEHLRKISRENVDRLSRNREK